MIEYGVTEYQKKLKRNIILAYVSDFLISLLFFILTNLHKPPFAYFKFVSNLRNKVYIIYFFFRT